MTTSAYPIRTLAATAALALTAGALAALATTGPAFAGPTADPMTGAPTVGSCSTMTETQAGARADHSTIVDCSRPHTAQVAGVVTLPGHLQWDQAGNRALYQVVASRCLPKLQAVLGRNTRTRDSSAYDLLWFAPTKGQIARGARWLSCSVELRHATSLGRLPTSTAPFLPGGSLPDRVARCLTKSALTTSCSQPHRWRASGAFTVAGAYPGQHKLNSKADRKCRSRVTADKPYRWTYQDKVTWNAGGDHVVVCYSPSRS